MSIWATHQMDDGATYAMRIVDGEPIVTKVEPLNPTDWARIDELIDTLALDDLNDALTNKRGANERRWWL